MRQLTRFKPVFCFYTPENVRKPLVFCRFQEVLKWNIGLEWVKEILEQQQNRLDELWHLWKSLLVTYFHRKWLCKSVISLKINNSMRYPFGIYLPKVNNRNTRTRCEIYSKIKIKRPERRHDMLVSFLLILNIFHTLFQCFYC